MTDLVNEQVASPSFSCLASNFTPPLLLERSAIIPKTSLIGEETKVRLLKKEKINFVEYNSGYIDYAKQNRKKSTKVENIFWAMVKNRKFLWYKFRRQKVIWSFILDFYCSKLMLWIELDGWYHNERVEYDIHRDSEIYKKWILVIRFKNGDIEKNLSWVISELEQFIKERTTPPLLSERSAIIPKTSLIGEETKMMLLKKKKTF